MDEFNETILKYSKIDRSLLVIPKDDKKFPKIETGIILF
jgi:hypothetical protein